MFANSKNSSREGSKHNMNGLGKHKSLQGPLDQPPTIYKYAYANIHARRSFLLFFLEDRVRRRGFSLTSQILNASASHTQDSPTLPPKIPAHIRARAENGKPTHPLLSQLDTNWQCPTDFTEVFCGLAQTIYHGTMGPPTNFLGQFSASQSDRQVQKSSCADACSIRSPIPRHLVSSCRLLLVLPC